MAKHPPEWNWQTSSFAKLGGEPASPHKPDFEVCPGSTGPRGLHVRAIPELKQIERSRAASRNTFL